MLMIFLISALFHAYSMIKVIEFNTLEEIIFEGIKLGDSRNYWSISWQLVPTKIIRKLAVREYSET